MRCVIVGCDSDNQSKWNPCKDVKFFSFPKDPNLSKKWLHLSKRKDKVNIKNAVVCSKHFCESDYRVNLKHTLLGYTPKNYRGLKDDAIPTQNLPQFVSLPGPSTSGAGKGNQDQPQNTKESDQPTNQAKFPLKNQERTSLWVSQIKGINRIPTKNDRLCSKHFKSDMFYQIGNKRCLLDEAIPTTFLESPKLLQSVTRPKKVKLNNYADMSEERVNIDLTDDNADLFGTILQPPNNGTKNSQTPTQPQDPKSISVIDTLRSIQQGNPQIETIFIESDEDDKLVKEDNIQMHDIQTTSTPYNAVPNNVTSFSSASEVLGFRVPDNSQNPGFRPFTVREILPSQLTSNIVRNANTIALQDDSKTHVSKRFLVIPREVLPFLANSKGPISLNVPGIGPLIIPRPSEIVVPSNASVNIPTPVKKVPAPAVYDPLCDPKFQCWRYRRGGVKRDLDGYTMSDRLGFYKAEQKRGKICAAKCYEMVKKLECAIHTTKRKLAMVQGSKFNMENIQLVEIDKIKRGRKKHLPQNENKMAPKTKPNSLSTVQKKNLKTLKSWKQHFASSRELPSSESDGNNADQDLLLTKKVVVLKQKTKQERKKKRGTEDDQDFDATEKMSDTEEELVSSDPLEEFNKKKKRGRPRKNSDNEEKRPMFTFDSSDQQNKKAKRGRPRKFQFIDTKKPIQPIKKKKGRPKKLEKVTQEDRLPYKKIYKVKPCYVDISPVKLVPEVIKKYKTMNYQVIDDLKEFQSEIDPAKPILVVNKMQYAQLDLKKLSFTNNIVFPTLGTDNISIFRGASNVKFVKPKILCKYLSRVSETSAGS